MNIDLKILTFYTISLLVLLSPLIIYLCRYIFFKYKYRNVVVNDIVYKYYPPNSFNKGGVTMYIIIAKEKNNIMIEDVYGGKRMCTLKGLFNDEKYKLYGNLYYEDLDNYTLKNTETYFTKILEKHML